MKKIQHVITEMNGQCQRRCESVRDKMRLILKEYELSPEQEKLLELTLIYPINIQKTIIDNMDQLIKSIITKEVADEDIFK